MEMSLESVKLLQDTVCGALHCISVLRGKKRKQGCLAKLVLSSIIRCLK